MHNLFAKYIFLKETFVYVTIFLFLNLVTGCNTYKSVDKTKISVKKLTSYTQKDNYFIVHEPDTTWQLYKPIVWQSDLIGLKIGLDDCYINKKSNYSKGKLKSNKKDSVLTQVIKEIHIYTESVVSIDSVRMSIPIESIDLIQFYQPQ